MEQKSNFAHDKPLPLIYENYLYLKLEIQMTIEERFNLLESELKEIRSSQRILEMSISPLKHEHLQRLCWITSMLQPRKTSTPLIRLGSSGDGGYVLAPPSKGKISLSIGVGEEISIDLELVEKFDHTIFAFDPFADRPPQAPENFIFHKIGMAAKSRKGDIQYEDISTILKRLPEIPEVALIDIEGSEWDLAKGFKAISKIKQVVIEFHGLHMFVDDSEYRKIKKLLTQFLKTHHPIHIHGNNAGSTVRIPGAVWPSIIEVTFLRKDQFDASKPEFNYGPWPGT